MSLWASGQEIDGRGADDKGRTAEQGPVVSPTGGPTFVVRPGLKNKKGSRARRSRYPVARLRDPDV